MGAGWVGPWSHLRWVDQGVQTTSPSLYLQPQLHQATFTKRSWEKCPNCSAMHIHSQNRVNQQKRKLAMLSSLRGRAWVSCTFRPPLPTHLLHAGDGHSQSLSIE